MTANTSTVAPRDHPSHAGAGPRIPGLRWRLMALIIFPLTFFMSLDRTNMSVSAPIIQREFNFSLVEMSIILTAFSWTYALFQVPGGLAAERFGSRLALTLADVWWSIMTVLTAFSFNFASFVTIRGLLGIGQAADWPSSVHSISRWFPRSERARANSILLGGLYLGPIIGTPLTAALIGALGWQWSFYIYGVLGLLMGLAWYAFFRDRPEQHPSISTAEAEHIRQGNDALTSKQTSGWSDWKLFLSSIRFWAYGIQYFFLVLIQSFFTTWLPTYLLNARGFSLASMGIAASLPWVALFAMVFVGGQWQDRVLARTGSKLLARTPFAVAGFILAALFLVLASRVDNPPLMIVLLMVSLGSVGLVQVAIWPTATDLGGQMTGSVSGWANFWGNLSGAAGPIFTAFLVGLSDWASALLVVSVAALVGAALWLLVHPERPLETPEVLVPAPAA